MSKRVDVTLRVNRFPQTRLALKESVLMLVEKAVVDIAAMAATDAPYRTGALQQSISHEVEGTFTGAEGIVYTTIEYAPYQEYGTVRNAAHPYMVPAAEVERAQLRMLGRAMGKRIEDAARG